MYFAVVMTAKAIALGLCLLITAAVYGVISIGSPPVSKDGQQSSSEPRSPYRLNSVPVHYASGTHYEVGYSVGKTYGSMINEFVQTYEPLKEEFLPLYNTHDGRQIYDESLAVTKSYFPQYVSEMQGMADGSGVPFHKLFLMALDDTLPKNCRAPVKDKGAVGCTSLMINEPGAQLLGHTEDALSETVNHFYIMAVHVKPHVDEMGGKFPAREEKFEALTYAGHLPGYASGHNYHGLVFSINTIFVSKPLKRRIPREFITRALLSSKSELRDVVSILTNDGAGTADGFNVNFSFLDMPQEMRVFYTAEVIPCEDETKSIVSVNSFGSGQNSLHTNRLLHLTYPELKESGYSSSLSREDRYSKLTAGHKAMTQEDMLNILGNREDCSWPIFSDRSTARVSTIHLGVFDFENKTWTMWTNDPLTTPPLVRLPLTFTDLISPIENYDSANKVEEAYYPSL